MAAKKETVRKPIMKGGILCKGEIFAIVHEDDLMEVKQGYSDDEGSTDAPWTPEEVISDFLEENFTHRGCGNGNCNLTEERLKKFSLAEKKTTLKVHGYRLVKVTFEEL